MGPSLGLVRHCGEGAAGGQGDLALSEYQRTTFIAVLVWFDDEPYYFPYAGTLLKALQRSAQEVNVTVSPPGPNGWNPCELNRVEELLRLRSYPPCAAVAACLRKLMRFAHQGEGYREGPPMPGGNLELNFTEESWDDPGLADASADAAIGGENLATPENQDRGNEGVETLEE